MAARRTSASQSSRSRNGNKGENEANALHMRCQLAGVAVVTKVASNLKVVGNLGGGFVKAAMVKKSVVDFMGFMLVGGRVVAVEAKYEEPKRAVKTTWRPCSLSMSRVEPHQRAMLDSVLKAGGVAVLLVVHGSLAQYAVPWAEARLVEGTLRDEALERHKVGMREAYLGRWLEGAR
jgi:penicillin-binding protein-related factor A (putative recombinase)